jgi:hypothetical protein
MSVRRLRHRRTAARDCCQAPTGVRRAIACETAAVAGDRLIRARTRKCLLRGLVRFDVDAEGGCEGCS